MNRWSKQTDRQTHSSHSKQDRQANGSMYDLQMCRQTESTHSCLTDRQYTYKTDRKTDGWTDARKDGQRISPKAKRSFL